MSTPELPLDLNHQPADLAEAIEMLRRASALLEVERMRLAACGVAAMQNTPATIAQRVDRNSPYYSASYEDVCRAVDREISLRAQMQNFVDICRRFTERVERGEVRSTRTYGEAKAALLALDAWKEQHSLR